ISEKWQKYSGAEISFLTQEYLQSKFPRATKPALAVNAAWLPTEESMGILSSLRPDQALYWGQILLSTAIQPEDKNLSFASERNQIQLDREPVLVQKSWKIFQYNAAEIRKDSALITKGRVSQPVGDPHTVVY